jgi:hypothetical protein
MTQAEAIERLRELRDCTDDDVGVQAIRIVMGLVSGVVILEFLETLDVIERRMRVEH